MLNDFACIDTVARGALVVLIYARASQQANFLSYVRQRRLESNMHAFTRACHPLRLLCSGPQTSQWRFETNCTLDAARPGALCERDV
jgi:hypothetical protein